MRVATLMLLAVTGTLMSSSAIAVEWKYSSFPDPGTGHPLRVATVQSSTWKGTLIVRMLPDGGVGLAFGVPATIVCSDPCQVRTRINGKDDGLIDARFPGNKRNMLFFSPRALPFAKVRASSKLEVEVQTVEHGWRVVTFRVDGFEIDRLNAAY